MKKRKMLSYLLSLTLMMTSMPTQFFAAQMDTQSNEIYVESNQQTTTSSAIQLSQPEGYTGNGFKVGFEVTNQWAGAFNANMTITNTGEKALENWSLSFEFEHEISNMWNAQVVKHEAGKYSIKNMGWNQDIEPGQSITIGFQATYENEIVPPQDYSMDSREEIVDTSCYDAHLAIKNYWGSGYNGELVITNLTDSIIEDWRLEFDFPGNIANFWEADIIEHSGDYYVIKNRGYNANIQPHQSITLGFSGDGVTNDSVIGENFKLYAINEIEAIEEIDYEKDSDQDDLPDYYEEELGTQLLNPDSDGDGIPDGYEYWELMTDPLLVDSDDNGISDADEDFDEDHLLNSDEYRLGTDPYNDDTDEDGLLDGDEVNKFATNPLTADEIDYDLDSDGDGLADGLEMRLGTDLNSVDTDGDDLPDGYELLTVGSNPLKVDSDDNGVLDGQEDLDNDHLSNLSEYQLETDPLKADTDKDDLLDGDEIDTYHTDPLLYDTDGDTIGDGDEIKIGLNPLSTVTNGIPDNEYTFEQQVSEEALAYVNTEDNDYTVSIDLVASGNAADNVVVATSQYANTISSNEAIVGKTISIDYYEGTIEEGALSFKLDEAIINQTSMVNDTQLEGLKRYYVFNYNEEVGMLVPVPTAYDESTQTLEADMVHTGTYCIMDLEKWFLDIGVLGESTISQTVEVASLLEKYNSTNSLNALCSRDTVLPSSNSVMLNQLLEAQSVQLMDSEQDIAAEPITTSKKVDLVFVVETGYTMNAVIDSVKSGMKEIVEQLQAEDLDIAVSIIEHNNITAMDSALAIKINGTLATEAEGSRELSFTKEPEEIESLIDQITPMGGYEREISGTPLAGLGYVTTLPFRNNASKFALLITDKSYSFPNCHGFNGVYDLLDCLKEKNVTLSISTMSIPNSGSITDMTVQNYKRWFNRIDGVFVLLRKFNDNIDPFNEFVLTHLIEEDEFTILKSNSLETVTLKAPLVKGGTTDSDEDGLTDSKEVFWKTPFIKYVSYNSNEYELPTLEEILSDVFIRYEYTCDNFPYLDKLNQRVLPLKSDLTEIDSDGDGLLDPEDDMPFINDYAPIWYRVPILDKKIYLVQENYSEEKLYLVDMDENRVYNWNENGWIIGDRTLEEIIAGEEYKLQNGDIYDAAGNLVSIDIGQQFNTNYIYEYMEINNVTASVSEQRELVYLGIGAGVIESFFPDEDTDIVVLDLLNFSGKYNNYTNKVATMPSSLKIKQCIFEFCTNKTIEELESNEWYLSGKLGSQVFMTIQFLATGGKIVLKGIWFIGDGIGKVLGGGTLSVTVPILGEIGGIPLAAVGIGEATAGAGIAATGVVYASKAKHSSEKAYETYEKLKGADNTEWEKISKELQDKDVDVSSWNKGHMNCAQDSLAKHFVKHGKEVGATSVEQYLRKAEGFRINLRGATKHPVDGYTEGVMRYIKNGKYIDLAPDNTIVSYGKV